MYAVGKLGEVAKEFFLRHLALYTALLILFAMGIGFGAMATQSLSQAQRADLADYVSSVLSTLAKNSLTVANGRAGLARPHRQHSQDNRTHVAARLNCDRRPRSLGHCLLAGSC